MPDTISLTLYNNRSMPNVVFKDKTTLATLTGEILENVNRERVTITIPYNANFASINYGYIPQFNRYYFVDVDMLTGGLLRLTMRSDALSSFWNNYKSSQCIARRSSSNYNPAIKDDLKVFKPQPIYNRRKTIAKFTPSSTGGCYILTVGGKY